MPFYLVHRYNPKEPHQTRKQPFGTEPEAVIHACTLLMAGGQGEFVVENDKGDIVANDLDIRGRCKATRMP